MPLLGPTWKHPVASGLSRRGGVPVRRLDHLVEQLWAPALASGGVRVVTDAAPDPRWSDVERYWAVPDLEHARILIPRGNPKVTAGALTNYRGLRFPAANLARAGAGTLAHLGLPLSRHTVAVQVRTGVVGAREALPLAVLARQLAVARVHASIGIRTGDNRKATLALLDTRGRPLGHAKFGWDPVTDGFVATETRALRKFGGLAGPVRAPAALAEFDYHGHPVVVTQPLPLQVRGAMNNVAEPSSQELYFLTPVRRRAAPRKTEHLGRVAQRLLALATDPTCGSLADRAGALLRRICDFPDEVPVTERWHGDLTPWNRARESDGQLWVWDWENCEEDTVAGLDALHWAFSVRRLAGAHLSAGALADCLAAAAGHLIAAGVPRRARPVVAGIYALVVVERACALAAHHRSWAGVWIGSDALALLLRQADQLLDQVTGSASPS
jgi:hypothetical protein